MSRWLLDLGNTRLKVAPLRADGSPGPVVAIDHRGGELGAGLDAVLPRRIEVAYLASVVDTGLRVRLLEVLAGRCRRICIAQGQRQWPGLHIAYADPARLGVDRFLALLAADAGRAGAALVCGVGTALTVDLVDGAGVHRGGRIAPSPTLMREALQQRVPHLPREGGEYSEFAIGTLAALASGCEGAALGLIERSLEHASRMLGGLPRLLLHGGGADPLLAHLPAAQARPDLVLEGLARWAAQPVDTIA